jgi:hypothetical protein
MEQVIKRELAGETEMLGKSCQIVILSTTKPTWIDLGSNSGHSDEKPPEG